MLSVLNWISSMTGMSPLTCAAVGVGMFVAILYFKVLFRSFGGLRLDLENIANHPLFFRTSSYDHVESRWSRNKILIWILLSVGSGILAFHQLPAWFPRMFPMT